MIYFAVLILLLFCVFQEAKGELKNNSRNDIIYYFLLLAFICLTGFRYRVGGDTLAYINWFDEVPEFDHLLDFNFSEAKYNPLWYVFNSLAKLIYSDFVTFQLLHAFVVNSIIFWFIKKYSSKKYLALVFYYFWLYTYLNMEVLREALAICCFLVVVPSLIKNSLKKYYIGIAIAMLFHTSAIVLLILPFLLKPIKKKYFLICAAICLVFSFFDIVTALSTLSLPVQIASKIQSYAGREINIYGKIMQLLIFCPPVIIYYFRQKVNAKPHYFDNFILTTLILGTLSMVLGGAYRFLNYFTLINLLYVVDGISIKLISKQFNLGFIKPFALSCLLFSQFYYYYRDMSKHFEGTQFYMLYYPYHSVFNPKIEENRERMYYKMMYLEYHHQNIID